MEGSKVRETVQIGGLEPLRYQYQKLDYDHEDSDCLFEKQPKVQPAAEAEFGLEFIVRCWSFLKTWAEENSGLEDLQVFKHTRGGPDLCFFEDSTSVTAFIPGRDPVQFTVEY